MGGGAAAEKNYWPVGTPTGRVGVLVLFGMRAGRALGGLFGLWGFDGVAFGGAGKWGSWVRPDQVILHFFQVREDGR